jgi:AcrR family transcriptional regulator
MPTQAERRATTHQALLDAAAEQLVAEGLAGFTTIAVTQRAGLSNGALFSHFPTRLDLLAATVEHILANLRHDYENTFSMIIDAESSPATMIELLWSSMNDPSFGAVLGVYTQARTDTELLHAIHEIVVRHGSFVGAINRRVARTYAPDPERAARLTMLGQLAIIAMQGMVVSHMVGASMGGERDLVLAFTNLYELARQAPADAPVAPGGT